MSARDRILARVRAAAPRAAAHPGAHPPPALPGDAAAFGRALEAAGGTPVGPVAQDALGEAVARRVARAREGAAADGRIVVARSATPPLRGAPFSFEVAAEDAAPQSFDDVGVAVVRGAVAVAESGAAALLADDLPARSLAFLCTHLIVLVEMEDLVPDLHRAFARLPAHVWRRPHLTWVAGPSKTADIEQTLVLGAHGPLGQDVVLWSRGG